MTADNGGRAARSGGAAGRGGDVDVLETIAARYSVRGYRPDPVDDEPFRLIVIHTEGREEELGRVYGRRWFAQAPLVVAVVAVPGEAWRRMDDKPYDEVDATIAMDHLILAAASLGLGTCWVAAFDPDAAREVLGLPDDVEPVAFTPLGYPEKARSQTARKPLDELVRYERW
jgi:nitroreductase